MRRFHELPPEEYAGLDIGEVNLECAERLPGSENLDIPGSLRMLNRWADLVRHETQRLWPRFERDPQDFNDSPAYFRMLVMTTVLQRDLGVHYDLDSLDGPFDASDSRPHFIHGILEGRGGTCANLPVLYTAIGRRLGYPLKLVQAITHWFVRWDDPQAGTQLNIEATAHGLICHPDEHYTTWPKPMRPELVAGGWVLKSLEPCRELAAFYEMRGRCSLDNRNYRNAMELGFYASQLCDERHPFHQGFHAIATVLCKSSLGIAKYDFKRSNGDGIVREKGIERPMRPDEVWAVREAEEQLARIDSIHERKIDNKQEHASEEIFARLADDPHYVR